MDKLTCAKEISEPIYHFGTKYIMDHSTFEAAANAGIENPMAFYVVGRFGPLGNISGDEAAAIAHFTEPNLVKSLWDDTVPGPENNTDPKEVGKHFADAIANWGEAHLPDEDYVEQFVDLAEKVVDSASDTDAPLFSALRQMDRPSDIKGKAMFLVHILRELRFARHSKQVKDSGMDPLMAILATPGGEDTAKMFQWSEPFPELTDEIAKQRADIEDATDRASAEDFGVLAKNEMTEIAAAAKQLFESC